MKYLLWLIAVTGRGERKLGFFFPPRFVNFKTSLSWSSFNFGKEHFIINSEMVPSIKTLGTCQSTLRSIWVIQDVRVIKHLLLEWSLTTLGKVSRQLGEWHNQLVEVPIPGL